MKALTKTLLLTTTLITSTLASSDNYLLLNDMKQIKQESLILENMSKNINDKEKFLSSKKEFSVILDGLIGGSDRLKLRGTEIASIKSGLLEIKKAWNGKDKTLDSSSLKSIHSQIDKVAKLYTKSYSKFVQKRKIASIVNQYMSTTTPNRQVIALYEKF
jgi:hypothetical protein